MRKILRALPHSFKKFRQNAQGNVLVEFSLLLPLIILILAALFELTTYALVYNKVSRFSGVLGDMISRQNVSRETIEAYCKQAPSIMAPFDFNSGQIVVSQVQNAPTNNDPTNMRISWQFVYQGGVSRLGGPGSPPALSNGLELTGDQSVIVTEVFYTYTPLIFSFFVPPQQIYHSSTFVPRIGSMDVLLGEGS